MKTVKRKANVGDKILIIKAAATRGAYGIGDIGIVAKRSPYTIGLVYVQGWKQSVDDSEYEVIIEEAVGMENKVQKRGSLWKKAVPTDDYHERLAFIENEDGTFSLNFKKIPALVHVSYDGNGVHDQTFLHGDYKAEAQRIKIESAVGELTSYTIDSLAVLKPVEEDMDK